MASPQKKSLRRLSAAAVPHLPAAIARGPQTSFLHASRDGAPLINKKSLAMTYSPAIAVPSALKGLTSVFGMGTGGTPSLLSPD